MELYKKIYDFGLDWNKLWEKKNKELVKAKMFWCARVIKNYDSFHLFYSRPYDYSKNIIHFVNLLCRSITFKPRAF